MTISVIMPVWVTGERLYTLTKSALASLGHVDELIIVDNNSEMGGDQFSMTADIYVRNKRNLGYPKAVNQGVALAHGDLLVIANNDIKVSSNWQEITQKLFKDYKDMGSLHFRMLDYDGLTVGGTEFWLEGKERWCTGSFFVWRKKAWKKPPMDENYGLGGYDDWDWHHRMNHIDKWKSGYTNAAVYHHLNSATLSKVDEKFKVDKNREYFKSKFGEYPEDIWEKKYPEQMRTPYLPFP